MKGGSVLRPSAAARTPWTAWVLLAAFGLAAAGCAAFETVTHQVARPVKYRLVGADADLRKNLERGLGQLRAEHYQAGIDSFNARCRASNAYDKSLKF